jgi:hypothetical protein
LLIRHRHFAFKQRNFDHETRQLRKRGTGDDEEDTVEKAVAGLAEQIIKEDEEKRKEELVRLALVFYVCQADHDSQSRDMNGKVSSLVSYLGSAEYLGAAHAGGLE